MTDSSPQKTKKPRILPFTLLGLVLLIATIFIVMKWANQKKPKRNRTVISSVPYIKQTPVALSNNQAVFSTGGFVNAKHNSQIAAEVNGSVLSLSPNFEVGNKIMQGEAIAIIDDSNYVAAVANARASLATAKSNYTQEQAKSRQAARDAKRLGVKRTDLLLRKPQLAAAKASISNAEAQLKLAEKNLSKTTIKAPFNGVIQARHISLGDNVNANSKVAQLVSTDTYTVQLTMDRNLFSLTAIGNKVILKNPNTGATYSAKIIRFSPTLDQATRTASVFVEIDNPLSNGKPLLINTYLLATITGRTIPDSMWINNNDSVENQFVWIKKANDTIEKLPFTLFYRGPEKSLVTFNKPITEFISQPKDSFYIGEKVTTEKPKKTKRPQKEGQQGKSNKDKN